MPSFAQILLGFVGIMTAGLLQVSQRVLELLGQDNDRSNSPCSTQCSHFSNQEEPESLLSCIDYGLPIPALSSCHSGCFSWTFRMVSFHFIFAVMINFMQHYWLQ